MPEYREVQPHGQIKEVFNNIFMVTGSNKIHHEGIDIQTSRNMIIVRENDELTLINTVRLDDNGLAALDVLGHVKNIVRIGAFHGYDDAFYLDHYHAQLWAINGMEHQSGHKTDNVLENNFLMPLNDCALFNFETSKYPEGILLLNRKEGNILITCDSIQNWTHKDEFMSDATFKMFEEKGFIQEANIPETWFEACQPELTELRKLKALQFKHLLSAHGDPLKEHAHEKVCNTLKIKFNI